MSPTTLHALRRLLFFSISEAARYVAASAERPAGVTERSWQHWETGDRPVPDDVAEQMIALSSWRDRALVATRLEIADARQKAEEAGKTLKIPALWYASVTDWMSMPDRPAVHWRPQCSVVAELAAKDGATLVLFDLTAYTRWLGKRRDGEGMRANWAGLQSRNTEQ